MFKDTFEALPAPMPTFPVSVEVPLALSVVKLPAAAYVPPIAGGLANNAVMPVPETVLLNAFVPVHVLLDERTDVPMETPFT